MGKWILKVSLILCLLISSSVGLIHYHFGSKKYGSENLPANELWIHRGFYDNKVVFENTIPAFDSVLKRQFPGIELDVFYIDSLNDFVVTHDMPNVWQQPTLLLSEVVNKYDVSFKYWLDLKNLNDQNKELICNRLKHIMKDVLIKRVYIESADAAPLGYLAENGFNTIYWIQYNRVNPVKKFLKQTLIKWNFIRYNFAGASIAASMADDDFYQTFAPVPKYVFHIYDAELYANTRKQANIAVYLMDFIPAEKNE